MIRSATATRRPRAYWPSLGILILLIVIGGLYLNRKSELSIIELYVTFYATSIAGLAFGIWPFVSAAAGSRWRAIALVAGTIVWRIAYFPVFVLAGWVATWFDWLSYSADLPVAGIYPVFTEKVIERGRTFYQEISNQFHPINHNRRINNQGRVEQKFKWAGIFPSWKTFPG